MAIPSHDAHDHDFACADWIAVVRQVDRAKAVA